MAELTFINGCFKGAESFVSAGAVLGRFLHSLNKFVMEEYSLEYDICDYKQYDFASVSLSPWRTGLSSTVID